MTEYLPLCAMRTRRRDEVVTPGDMLTDSSEVQPLKTESSMDVTLPGILTDTREEQPLKAECLMCLTLSAPLLIFFLGQSSE